MKNTQNELCPVVVSGMTEPLWAELRCSAPRLWIFFPRLYFRYESQKNNPLIQCLMVCIRLVLRFLQERYTYQNLHRRCTAPKSYLPKSSEGTLHQETVQGYPASDGSTDMITRRLLTLKSYPHEIKGVQKSIRPKARPTFRKKYLRTRVMHPKIVHHLEQWKSLLRTRRNVNNEWGSAENLL